MSIPPRACLFVLTTPSGILAVEGITVKARRPDAAHTLRTRLTELPMECSGDLEIVFQQEGGAAAQLVRDRLDMFNVGVTGVSAYYPVNFFLKNVRGEIMGGLLGGIWGGWLNITYLWVDESERGKDAATRMMDQAEAYARERHCHSVMLDTHSF